MKKVLFLTIILIGLMNITTKAVIERMPEIIIQILDKKDAEVITLLEAGADPNVSYGGKTALIWSIENSDSATVKKLIEKGADVTKQLPGGITPLIKAAARGDNTILDALLKTKSDINKKNNKGETALFYAVKRPNYKKIISNLIKNGAFIDEKDSNGQTPLMHAALGGNVNNVKTLLEYKPNQSIQDNQGNTALMYYLMAMPKGKAEESPEVEVLKLLTKDEAIRKIQNKAEKTAKQIVEDLGLQDEWYNVTGEYIEYEEEEEEFEW